MAPQNVQDRYVFDADTIKDKIVPMHHATNAFGFMPRHERIGERRREEGLASRFEFHNERESAYGAIPRNIIADAYEIGARFGRNNQPQSPRLSTIFL